MDSGQDLKLAYQASTKELAEDERLNLMKANWRVNLSLKRYD